MACTRPSSLPSQGRTFPPLMWPLLLPLGPGWDTKHRSPEGGGAGPLGSLLPWLTPRGPSPSGSPFTVYRRSCNAWSSWGLQKYHPRISEVGLETLCGMNIHPFSPRAALISGLPRALDITVASHLESRVPFRINMASESLTISYSLEHPPESTPTETVFLSLMCGFF